MKIRCQFLGIKLTKCWQCAEKRVLSILGECAERCATYFGAMHKPEKNTAIQIYSFIIRKSLNVQADISTTIFICNYLWHYIQPTQAIFVFLHFLILKNETLTLLQKHFVKYTDLKPRRDTKIKIVDMWNYVIFLP